jgi:hypothetical protein
VSGESKSLLAFAYRKCGKNRKVNFARAMAATIVHFTLAKEETSCVLTFVKALQLRKESMRGTETVGVTTLAKLARAVQGVRKRKRGMKSWDPERAPLLHSADICVG